MWALQFFVYGLIVLMLILVGVSFSISCYFDKKTEYCGKLARALSEVLEQKNVKKQ